MARQSQSVNKPDMEGILEKVGTSITSKFISGKAKFWCELHGALLYLYKENKRSSTLSQQIDMNFAQLVLKSSSDKSGNSFEIQCNNKAQVFCAPSAQECSTWIQHLRHAMTLKDQTDVTHQTVTRESVRLADYEDITVDSGTISMNKDLSSSTKISPSVRIVSTSSEYAEVDFQNLPVSFSHTKENTASGSDSSSFVQSIVNDGDEYAIIGDGLGQGSEGHEVQLRSSVADASRSSQLTYSPQPPSVPAVASPTVVPCTLNSLTSPLSPPAHLQKGPPVISKRGAAPPAFIPPPPPTSPPPEVLVEDCGYSSIGVDLSTVGGSGQVMQVMLATEAEASDFRESSEKDSEGYTKMKVKPRTSPRDFATIKEVEEQGGADDHFDSEEYYVEVFSEGADLEHIPKFPSPLTEEDEQPLADLQEYLFNNRRICRPSFKDFGITEDPIGDLKKLLCKLQA